MTQRYEFEFTIYDATIDKPDGTNLQIIWVRGKRNQ